MSARAPSQPYQRWHVKDAPYLRRLRLRLEASLGASCAYCGLTREDGAELEFHHPQGKEWRDASGRLRNARQLSWSSRLHRYAAELKAQQAAPVLTLAALAIAPPVLTLACAGENSNHCHKLAKKGLLPHDTGRLYDYEEATAPANQPF